MTMQKLSTDLYDMNYLKKKKKNTKKKINFDINITHLKIYLFIAIAYMQ